MPNITSRFNLKPDLKPYMKSFSADFTAGLTGAIAGAPQAMGFALIAGVLPVYGLYSAIVATIIGALTSRSSLLTIAPTNALALIVFSTLPPGSPPSDLFLLTVLVGAFQLAFGLFRLGDLTRFVSNAVMTGFITGAGLLIMLNQLPHLTGYHAVDDVVGALPGLFDWLLHPGQWQGQTVLLGLISLLMIWGLHHTRFRHIATLVTLALVSAVAFLFGWHDVETVRDLAPVPASLPQFALPDFSRLMDYAPAALSMAVLALVQSAGITRSLPDEDEGEPDTNRDFAAQGLANLAAGFFSGMPSGGSISRTAVTVSAGAKTRFANIYTGIMIALALLLAANLIELVLLTALAAHLIIAAAGLIDLAQVRLVWRVSWSGRLAMLATFIATLTLPLEMSIYIGVVLSLVLYIYRSAVELDVVQLTRLDDGRYQEGDIAPTLPANDVMMVSVHGNLYFAAVQRLENILPPADSAHRTVVILRLRHNHYLGSTGIRFLRRYAQQLNAHNGRLMLVGLHPALLAQIEKTGILNELGADNVLPATPIVLEATDNARQIALAWLAESASMLPKRDAEPGAAGAP